MKRSGRWNGLLSMLAVVAYPLAAGAALVVLSLGVVTWLPALAATAHAMHRWRTDGDSRCFTGVFRAFGRYWRALARHGLASTAVVAVLLANTVFLLPREANALTVLLLAAQLGIGAVFVVYHLALAVIAGRADLDERSWVAGALAFGFGSAARGTALLGAAIAAPVLSIIVPFGPLLLGPSIPVLVGLVIADHPGRRSVAVAANPTG